MPYYNRDPKRDHNFDNHPSRSPSQAELPVQVTCSSNAQVLQGQSGWSIQHYGKASDESLIEEVLPGRGP